MNEKNASGCWQVDSLTRYLEENREDPLLDSKTILLSNPSQRIELDKIIKEQLWPAVMDVLDPTPFRILDTKHSFPSSGIKDEIKVFTCRTVTFILGDPQRPLLPGGGPPWYCRGKIECTPMDYMLSFDFSVYFRADFPIKRILRLLGDPMFAGNPPNLSVERGIGEENVFVIDFSEGSGAGWGIRNHEQAAKHLREKVKQNVAVIDAVYELEKDYKSTKNFKALHKVLREAYQSF
jgi:hypothetical protein